MSLSILNKFVTLNLNIGDQLTSISCGHIVVELIKFISYQRLQIPYTYQWLKQVITKKKECEIENVEENFTSERHFHAASTALENLDFILKNLLLEINGSTIPDEVCIALGSTPVTFKEVYRLLLPSMCHKPQCHSKFIATDQKIKGNVFRTLVTSESLSQIFFSSLAPTNMYVFIKKKTESNKDPILSTNSFVLSSGCRIPRSAKVVVLDFRTENQDNVSCCIDFRIFGDIIRNSSSCVENEDNITEFFEIESTDRVKWFQSCYIMKGFKDCVVNGSSITNQWLSS